MIRFIKVSAILFLLGVPAARTEDQLWDLAVVISGQVVVLNSNGSTIGAAANEFTKLKALTYDTSRKMFVVSDTNNNNDAIYTLQLSKETDVIPLVEDLPDDIQGVAVDPVNDILYWTDSINQTINYIALNNDSDPQIPNLFLKLEKQPHGIAVDSCNRVLYWTNSQSSPSIESSTLDGKNRKVLISKDLFMPKGIALDQVSQKIYWVDLRKGIYFRIESANFDGTDRHILYQGTHQKPFGLAVDKDYVYWTDSANNALWRKNKSDNKEPEILKHFENEPFGLVARNAPDCSNVEEVVPDVEIHNRFADDFENNVSKLCNNCLNNGQLGENCTCVCPRGFTGPRCEISLCYNYCNEGTCYLSQTGLPQCRCPLGYTGNRCEKDSCENFCLHGGVCTYKSDGPWGATCKCQEGFQGSRCESEEQASRTYMCQLFCENRSNELIIDQNGILKCSCEDGSYSVIEKSNLTRADFLSQRLLENYLQDPLVIALFIMLIVLICITFSLLAFVCKLKRMRPRIKKRIVVNKNITPLTYRPQPPTAQCEITIENCCNMNVCETPCFEPATATDFHGSKKEEKKTLLLNMENGDDLY